LFSKLRTTPSCSGSMGEGNDNLATNLLGLVRVYA
jgi:hypothetical protein